MASCMPTPHACLERCESHAADAVTFRCGPLTPATDHQLVTEVASTPFDCVFQSDLRQGRWPSQCEALPDAFDRRLDSEERWLVLSNRSVIRGRNPIFGDGKIGGESCKCENSRQYRCSHG